MTLHPVMQTERRSLRTSGDWIMDGITVFCVSGIESEPGSGFPAKAEGAAYACDLANEAKNHTPAGPGSDRFACTVVCANLCSRNGAACLIAGRDAGKQDAFQDKNYVCRRFNQEAVQ